MLGDSILVAPIFNENSEAKYYIPEGKWTNFITGKKYEGGRWIKEIHDYLSIPMLVKENSIIAVGANDTKPDYDYRKDVSLLAYELKDNEKAAAEILDMERNKSLSVEAIKNDKVINIKSEGTDGTWSLVLKNVTNVKSVEGASFVVEGNDTKITVENGNADIVCTLI